MNPIRYQDLISPDDSIEKLISQLTTLNEAYTGMADSIKAQAAGVAASLKAVSGATMAGQTATRNAATEADRLSKAYRDLSFARSDTARRIAELKAAQQEENRVTKLQVQLNNTAEGSYAHLSAQYSLNKMQLNQMTAAERENLPYAKKLEQETKAIYEQMKRLQEATGKYTLNVGNYEGAITSAIGINSRWYTQMTQLSTLFEGGMTNGLKMAGDAVAAFGRKLLALLANPIVATIAAITAAFMALSKGISTSEENTMALERVLAPFQRVLTGVINILQTCATYVLRFAEGFETAAFAVSRFLERIPFIGKYIKDANDAMQGNVDLAKAQQELTKKERANITERARLERDAAKARNEAERINDPKKRVALLKQADAAERQILENELKLAREDLRIKTAKAAQSKNNAKTNDELAQSQARLFKAEEAYYQKTQRLQSKIRTLSGKGAGGAATTADTGKDAAEQAKREQMAIEDARIAAIEDGFVRERATIITNYDRKIEDAKEQYGQETELAVLYEREKQMKLADLVEKEAKTEQDAKAKKLADIEKAAKEQERVRVEAVRREEEKIQQAYDLAMSEADLEKSENKKTQMRLQAERDRLTALLALYEKDGKTLTDVELQTVRNSIEAVDEELEKNRKDRDLFDMLGISLDDDQKQAVQDSFDFAKEQLSDYLDALQEAADRKRQLADEEVERAQTVLDAEREARAKGYAANVAQAQKDLDLARQTQQKAMREQERAQRAQAALQTVEQAGNLVTATSKIWAQLGFPFAIPAIAVMWGAFAAAKIKAAQLTRQGGEEQYGEGTVELLQGGSHQSGNDIDLGRKQDGTRRRAEGGEFFAVINKRNSRRYRSVIPSVINSLNDGTFAEKYMSAYGRAEGMALNIMGASPDLTRLSDDVRQIREQGEHERYTDGHGVTIERYKNVTRRILN